MPASDALNNVQTLETGGPPVAARPHPIHASGILPGTCDHPSSASTVKRNGPAPPFLVLMTITPLAASVPYRLAADGPRSTSIDSMVFGSMSSNRDGASPDRSAPPGVNPPTS